MKDTLRHTPEFEARLAQTPQEARAAERLRYEVFVAELGADGPLVDHTARREIDRFDAVSDQLILIDHARPSDDQVVGVYRLLDRGQAAQAGQFYSEDEFDLDVLKTSGRTVLELGRTCLHRDYRGGAGMFHIWQALAAEIQSRRAEVLFGVASFHGTDLEALAAPLTLLMRDHLAPASLRVTTKGTDKVPKVDKIDKIAALKQVPSLIKAYLRLGGRVGQGVYVDHAFNTTDVCLVLDTATMTARQRSIYGSAR